MFPEPPGETQRLDALARYDVLDSLPDAEFERITRLVARQLRAPIVFINFLDARHGWFKAAHGTLVKQQDRNMSVCAHTILQRDVLTVEDLTCDARFPQPIKLGDTQVHSYIGAPLVTPDGYVIGTLSAVDSCARSFTDDQRALMADLAAVVVDELELRLAVRKWRDADRRSTHAARHDALTGLPNRVTLMDRTDRALEHAEQHGTHVAVLMLDLDHFKHVNDSLGHHAGDHLLRLVAERPSNAVRSEDTVARLGGDEFVVLLPDLRDPLDAALVAEKCLVALREPMQLGSHAVHSRASVGIATSPSGQQDVQALPGAADVAMYHAKQLGGDRACFHTERLGRQAAAKLHVHTALQRAVHREEFTLYYQPQVDVRSGSVLGVEALLRWPQTDGHVALPSSFITLAEQTRLIIPLGVWVLHAACRQLRRWHDAGRTSWSVSVNVSAVQWLDASFPEHVHAALRDSGVPPACLVIELTESTFMNDVDKATEVLEALHGLGVRVSLDDFGMGYANLGQMVGLSFDELKLDRAFVSRMTSDARYASLVRYTINLASELGMTVVGEGVETTAERDALRALGCRIAQGFLFGPPVPPDAFT